jgi:glycosyltransferase involved in cell wall biosynthesis
MPEPSLEDYHLVVVVPVYSDWESASILCHALDQACAHLPGAVVDLVLVDDGSPAGLSGWQSCARRYLRSIRVLLLRRNLGHQRAITAGLCYVHEKLPCDAVLVMDGDGEDRPEDAIVLVKHAISNRGRIVFAERRKRVEGILFRLGYVLYRILHRVLTGISVRVGNFSVLPFSALPRLVTMSEMWNHYAGAVFKSKLQYDTVPLDRGKRYRGESHMNVVMLVNHGIAGIASFHDIAATRILIASGLATAVTVTALSGAVGIRLFTNLAIPGWATFTVGLLLVLLLQIVTTSFTLVFTLVANRWHRAFVPSRDHAVFVDRVEML